MRAGISSRRPHNPELLRTQQMQKIDRQTDRQNNETKY